MKREMFLYKIMGFIHIVFFTSICMIGITVLSGTLLSLPAIGAAFLMGKEQLYHRLDVNDSIVKLYFKCFKKAFTLMRFVPVTIVFLLYVAASRGLATMQNQMLAVVFLSMAAFVCLLQLYLVGYWVFVSEKVRLLDVLVSMLMKPLFLVPLYACVVLALFLGNTTLLGILFITGTFFLFAIEVVIFIQMLYYQKALGILDGEDEYVFLVERQGR